MQLASTQLGCHGLISKVQQLLMVGQGLGEMVGRKEMVTKCTRSPLLRSDRSQLLGQWKASWRESGYRQMLDECVHSARMPHSSCLHRMLCVGQLLSCV